MIKILCPVDFSSHSENAVIYSCEYARKVKGKVLIFHSYHSTTTPVYDAEFMDSPDTELSVTRSLEKFAIRIRETYYDVKIETFSQLGLAADKITEFAKLEKTDIIIMSTEGAKGIDTLIGTVASNVIEMAHCPVLVIPSGYQYKSLENIVYATDLKEDETKFILDIVKIAELYNARIYVLNIQEDHIHPREKLEDKLEKIIKIANYKKISLHINERLEILEGIRVFAGSKNADLIVTSPHKRNFFQKIINSSITRKISYDATIPLLALQMEGNL